MRPQARGPSRRPRTEALSAPASGEGRNPCHAGSHFRAASALSASDALRRRHHGAIDQPMGFCSEERVWPIDLQRPSAG